MSRAPWVLLKPETRVPRAATRRCTRRRSAGAWSTRRCPSEWTISLGESAEKLAGIYEHLARGAGRVRAAQPPAAPPRRGTTASTTTRSCRCPDTELDARRGHPRRHVAREARASSSPPSARTAPSPPATRRRSTTAPPRCCSASEARRERSARAARPDRRPRRARRRPRHLRHRPGRGRQPGAASAPASAGTTSTSVELNEAFAAQSLACLARVAGARPGEASTSTAARSRSGTRSARPARASSARSPTSCRRRGGGYGLAAICIGVGQGLAVVSARP